MASSLKALSSVENSAGASDLYSESNPAVLLARCISMRNTAPAPRSRVPSLPVNGFCLDMEYLSCTGWMCSVQRVVVLQQVEISVMLLLGCLHEAFCSIIFFPSQIHCCCDNVQKAAQGETSFHIHNCKDHAGFCAVCILKQSPWKKHEIRGFPGASAAHGHSTQLRRFQWPRPKSKLNLDGGMKIVPLSDCKRGNTFLKIMNGPRGVSFYERVCV